MYSQVRGGGLSNLSGCHLWLVPTGRGLTYHALVIHQFSTLKELALIVPMPVDMQKPRGGALLPVNTLLEANVSHLAWWAALVDLVL